MYRSTPTSEPGTVRAMAIQPTWRTSPGFGGFIASVVRGVDPADQWDGPDAKGSYRNCSWTSNKATALYVEQLEFTCQIDLPEADRTYANMYRYYWHGVLEMKQAEAMTKTYTRLQAAHTRLMDNEGHVSDRDYAHWLLRNGAILGMQEYLFPVDPGSQHRTLGNDAHWKVVKSRAQVYEEVKRLLDWYKGRRQ